MENNYDRDHFEEFLKDQLRNQRMFPKDEVWRQINSKLHGDKKWPALTIATCLLITCTIFICFHFSKGDNIFSLKPNLVSLQPATSTQRPVSVLSKNNLGLTQQINPYQVQENVKSNTSDIQNENNSVVDAVENEIVQNIITPNENADQHQQLNGEKEKITEVNKNGFLNSPNKITIQNPTIDLAKVEELQNDNIKVPAEPETVISLSNKVPENTVSAKVPIRNEDKMVSLIESFKSTRKPGKYSFLFYFAPSISYRKLVEDYSVIKNASNGPASLNQVTDVNDVVRHKPSSGMEAGLSILYDVTKLIRVKGGLQFNVRQYTIDAYKSNTEIGSIALNEGTRIDTINTLVYYRNYNGNTSTELRNRYYQISIPLGLEWQVVGNQKFQFNIGASIQPTLLLNRNAYLLTTNFKNYTEKDEMVRQWNLNSNIEAFVTMNTRGFKWQLGPQIRYQPNSTFIKQYPIKEHLIDYGIKLGVSTRLR